MACCCTTVDTGSVKVSEVWHACNDCRPRRSFLRSRALSFLPSLPPACDAYLLDFFFQIVERCGAFKYIAGPGINFMLPCLDIPTRPISMRLQQIEVACEVKTKDNVFTHMKVR